MKLTKRLTSKMPLKNMLKTRNLKEINFRKNFLCGFIFTDGEVLIISSEPILMFARYTFLSSMIMTGENNFLQNCRR